VNFVEVTCPLFRKDKLDAFMAVYDPVLVGYGVDWWFLETLGSDIEGKVAIVDAITCINPRDRAKGGKREINVLQDVPTRKRIWNEIRERYKIESEARGFLEFGSVKSPPKEFFYNLSTSANIITHNILRTTIRKARPTVHRIRRLINH
jgi:hypothetical protein